MSDRVGGLLGLACGFGLSLRGVLRRWVCMSTSSSSDPQYGKSSLSESAVTHSHTHTHIPAHTHTISFSCHPSFRSLLANLVA